MLFVSLFLATMSLAVGVFAYVVSRAPGANRDAGPSSLFIAASAYALSDALGYVDGIRPGSRAFLASVAFAAVGVFLLGAVRYVARRGGHEGEWTFKILIAAVTLAAVVCLVPGAVYTTLVDRRVIPFVGDTYFDTRPTLLGFAVFITYFLALVTVLVRMFVDWRRAVPFAAYYALAFGVLTAAASADFAAVLDLSSMPYLLTEGIFLAAVIFAAAVVRKINEDRIALDRLRVELESRVVDRTRELERRTEELSRSERLAVVGRLAAGIAHELNNPAAAIRASLDDARTEITRGGKSAEVLACIDISLAAVERVTRIVRQLGAMAGGAETLDRARASTNLEVIVKAAVASARDHARPDVIVTTHVDPEIWVLGFATAVEEALTAIVLNAVEAVPDGRPGTVDLSARVRSPWVEVTVRDNGAGMGEELVARAFEPFFTTKELGHASGLGLPVAKGLVETMGGRLELRSILGVGSEALIRFGLGEVPEISGPKRRPVDLSTPVEVPTERQRRPRVLLVDDDELVRAAMRRYLSRSYDVDTAGSVQEGLAMVSRAYDAILSDVVMPDGGGQRFLLELMARDMELASRIIFITGGAFRGDLQQFLQTQSQPVLHKPVRLSELTEAIGRLVPPPIAEE